MNDLLYVCSLISLEGRVKTSSKMACFLWILSIQSDAWKSYKEWENKMKMYIFGIGSRNKLYIEYSNRISPGYI